MLCRTDVSSTADCSKLGVFNCIVCSLHHTIIGRGMVLTKIGNPCSLFVKTESELCYHSVLKNCGQVYRFTGLHCGPVTDFFIPKSF